MVVALSLAGCTSAPTPPPACASQVRDDAIPEWARGGFTGDTRMPHVMGEHGDIVAILFGYPLSQPPRQGVSNKILWVAREPTQGDPMRIEARLAGTGAPVAREVPGGPGPSIVDMPQAGCWRFALSWFGRTDSVDLSYGAP